MQLAEGLHTAVQIVVDDGEAVAVVVKRFPTWEIQVLGIVHQVHAALQDVCSTHGREAVEVDANDEIGIIAHEGHQLVVDDLLVEVQLVELCVFEIEVLVAIAIQGRCIG